MPLFAGVDIGTTTLKAGLFSADGDLLRERSIPNHPDKKYGWDGVDPLALYASVKSLIREVVGADGRDVRGIALSSFGETVFPVDGDGPLHYGILWYEKCTREQFDRVLRRVSPGRLREIAKLELNWTYSSYKMLRFKEEFPEVYRRTEAFLDVSSFIIFMLTGERNFDLSLACRTQLLDVGRREWSGELIELSGLDAEKLPPVRAAGTQRGLLRAPVADELGLAPGTVVAGGGHDHVAGAFGVGVSRDDQAMISVGTSAAFYSPMPPGAFETEDFLSRTTLSGGYSAYPGGMYALTGLSSGGFCVDWFIHGVLGRDYDILSEYGSGGDDDFSRTEAMFLPNLRAFENGLPPGGFTGLSDSDTGKSMLQAIMEAIAFECRYTLSEIFAAKRTPQGLRELVMMGGAARNAPFVKILATALGSPISAPNFAHSAGLFGCAVASSIASGYFRGREEAPLPRDWTEHAPCPGGFAAYLDEKYRRHLREFRGITAEQM
jgi:xylulokinase